MRVRRRHELANITSLGDVNALAISGHVEHEPTLREDDDHMIICEFVLTHTTTNRYGNRWERQRYNVQAGGELGEYITASWQPGQAIVINGRLEYRQVDALAGPLPSVWIVAHTIDDTLGTHPHQQHNE
jgi:single-stranded DNA-binding protein